jgi:hypothetical protein
MNSSVSAVVVLVAEGITSRIGTLWMEATDVIISQVD